jgi:hypothetical protein
LPAIIGSQQRSTPVQIDPTPLYHHGLVERVIAYLQTKDSSLFPFTARFDAERQKAFINDLRTGLSDLTESGSKRGTSASGFLTSDKRLREIVENWAEAGGGWPETQNPTNAYGLAGAAPFDADPVG